MNEIPSILSLHKEKSSQENSKNHIYSIVLNKCIDKIKYTNKHTDQTYIIFDVPNILIGYPSYNFKSCILFLFNQLSKHGYMIEFIQPCQLYIDWAQKNNIIYSNQEVSSSTKLKSQTKTLLEKFPNTSKIEYIFEDNTIPEYNFSKKLLKKKPKK